MKKTILAKSSSGDHSYEVVFEQKEGVLTVTCYCPAGMCGQLCRHKRALLNADLTMLYDPAQKEDLLQACKLLKVEDIPVWSKRKIAPPLTVARETPTVRTLRTIKELKTCCKWLLQYSDSFWAKDLKLIERWIDRASSVKNAEEALQIELYDILVALKKVAGKHGFIDRNTGEEIDSIYDDIAPVVLRTRVSCLQERPFTAPEGTVMRLSL